jgi:predicted nucleic acid-binding protein
MSGDPTIESLPGGEGEAPPTAGPASASGPGPVCSKPYVIDTSVALKWYIPEAGFSQARRYMGPGMDRHAPDLLPLEGAHALLKRTRNADPALHLSLEDALMVAEALRDGAPIRYHSCGPLLGLSLTLAIEIGASVYDGLFLALAIRQDGLVVTADGRFRDKILASQHAARVRWFMDMP